ncbi:hypothetical protein MMC24_000478 [Lignoscripta atroalba]|nr:hypothetical protein [Lignoscripta atroalba]
MVKAQERVIGLKLEFTTLPALSHSETGREINTSQPAIYQERVVGIPIIGHGPRWEHHTSSDIEHMIPEQALVQMRVTRRRYRGVQSVGMRTKGPRDELANITFSALVIAFRIQPNVREKWIEGEDWKAPVQHTADPVNWEYLELRYAD